MEILLGIIALIVVVYLISNKTKNSDPLNRKCAAEICEYLVSTDQVDPQEIALIFDTHARYQKQALHIVSMIPNLLINGGIPSKDAMSLVPLLQMAALLRPK
jgi:hypothetical protein